MKTIVYIKKIIAFTVLIALGTAFTVSAVEIDVMQYNDSSEIVKIVGKVINKNTGEPVIFASVYKTGSNIGTVSNSDGEFVLKIPGGMKNGELGVSYIGYKNYTVPLSNLSKDIIIVKLEPSPIPIKEVVVRVDDPVEILRMARRKTSENYSTEPFMMTAFYREVVQQNRSYVAVAEAVLDVYKSSYINDFDFDRVKIFKGRKSMDVKKMDTILFKLQGGPRTSFLLDVVKNPAALLSEEFIDSYEYQMNGVIEIDKRQTYVITFDQRKDVDLPLYAGKIFIDADNLAISGIEFKLSEVGINRATEEYVKKRPANTKVKVEAANYLVNYREIDGKWYFNNIRSELKFDVKWDKKLFRSNFTTVLEMAVTDMNFENIERFKNKESAKLSDVFTTQVNYFEDNDFWGDYNTIKPEESIEVAISKLNKKVLKK